MIRRLGASPTQALGVVMEDGAGGAAFEAAPRSVIEFMGSDFDGQGQIRRHARQGWLPLGQSGLEVADAFFHAAIVAGQMGWIIQGQHAEAGHHLIHLLVIKRGTVVAFEEQRRTVLTEEAFQMPCDLATVQPVGDQRPEAIARGQLLHGNDLAAGITVLGGVAGPGQSGPKPLDAFHGQESILPVILHPRTELAARQRGGEVLVEFTGSLRAHPPVVQLPQERIELRPVQR